MSIQETAQICLQACLWHCLFVAKLLTWYRIPEHPQPVAEFILILCWWFCFSNIHDYIFFIKVRTVSKQNWKKGSRSLSLQCVIRKITPVHRCAHQCTHYVCFLLISQATQQSTVVWPSQKKKSLQCFCYYLYLQVTPVWAVIRSLKVKQSQGEKLHWNIQG